MADIADVKFIIFDKSKGRLAHKEVYASLGEQSFDIALCMHASLRANFLYRKIRAPIRLGFDYKRAKDLQWLFTNRRIDAKHGQHALEAMMSFSLAIGVKPQPIRWDIPLDRDVQEFATEFRSPNKPLVLISPCSSDRSRNFRNWSADNYRQAIGHLIEKGCRVVITGGPSALEVEYAEVLSQGGQVDNLVAKTSLKQLAALINEADLLICPDSGPAHMATAFGTPVIGLYATSNPERTGPYVSRELTVNRYPDAALRFLGKTTDKLRWGQRVRHPDAMALISVDEVIAKIASFFDIDSVSGRYQ